MPNKQDILWALLLHLAAAVLIISASLWKPAPMPVPQRTIAVDMVSLKALQAMTEQHAKAVPPVHKPSKPKPKKHQASKPKSKPKPKPKRTRSVAAEPDYDPFAPLESESVTPSAKPKPTSSRQTLNSMMQGQLSQQEIDRYILDMQRAVERQWKVPMEMMDRVKPALVELVLSRKGDVVSATILESSGSAQMDETLIKAIYAAAPFRLPSQQFALFERNKIRFFPLQ